MHIIVGEPRKFGNLKAGEDSVYLIDPNTGHIVASKIRSIKTLRSNGRISVLEIKIYRLTAFDSVTEEKLEKAHEEYNTKIDWTFRVLNQAILGPVTFKSVGVPTMISADKPYLEKWMKETGPGRKKIIF